MKVNTFTLMVAKKLLLQLEAGEELQEKIDHACWIIELRCEGKLSVAVDPSDEAFIIDALSIVAWHRASDHTFGREMDSVEQAVAAIKPALQFRCMARGITEGSSRPGIVFFSAQLVADRGR
jgi:hypothetical protein